MTETMTFGVKTTEDTNEGGSGGDYIHRFAKDGEYRLRFLEEFEEWTSYFEHFSGQKKTSYPCTGDRRTCPGCTSPDQDEAKAAKRYLVNAVLQDPKSDKQGYAHLWKLPAPSMKEPLSRFAAKSGGTLTDRDYTVIRYTNDSGQVRYNLDREEQEPLDLSKWELQDHQAALMQEYLEAWDETARAAKQERQTAAKEKREDVEPKKTFRMGADPAPQTEPEPEVPDALLSKQERDAKAAAATTEPEPEVEVSPSSIRSMSAAELVKLFKQAGFESELDGLNGSDRDALAEALIKLLSE